MGNFILYCIALAIMAVLALESRNAAARLVAAVVWMNWLLWSVAVLLSAPDWEPWRVAMALDELTALFLFWHRQSALSWSFQLLVCLHFALGCEWLDVGPYLIASGTITWAQCIFVMAMSRIYRLPRTVVHRGVEVRA